MRISDWSSDVCSSDLSCSRSYLQLPHVNAPVAYLGWRGDGRRSAGLRYCRSVAAHRPSSVSSPWRRLASAPLGRTPGDALRSEEHTSELQSLMRISYAVFCLKKKTQHIP